MAGKQASTTRLAQHTHTHTCTHTHARTHALHCQQHVVCLSPVSPYRCADAYLSPSPTLPPTPRFVCCPQAVHVSSLSTVVYESRCLERAISRRTVELAQPTDPADASPEEIKRVQVGKAKPTGTPWKLAVAVRNRLCPAGFHVLRVAERTLTAWEAQG